MADDVWTPDITGTAGPKYKAVTTAIAAAVARGDLRHATVYRRRAHPRHPARDRSHHRPPRPMTSRGSAADVAAAAPAALSVTKPGRARPQPRRKATSR